MAEAAINPRQPERIESGRLERAKRPETDGVVSVMGVRTGIGILVTVNGCGIGLAENDGSEKETDARPANVEKPIDDISRLKAIIMSQTNSDTQKIALYLAELFEQGGKKVRVMHLAEKFGLAKIIVHRILVTLDTRAINNGWPLLVSYSQSAGVNFVTRKQAFGPR